jgi:hypothetical protein
MGLAGWRAVRLFDLAHEPGWVRLSTTEPVCPFASTDVMADAPHPQASRLLELIRHLRMEGRPGDVLDDLPTDEADLRSTAEALDAIGVEAYNADMMERAHDAFYLLFMCRLRIVERHPDARGDIRDFASAEDLLGAVMIDLGNIEAADRLVPESLRYRQSLLQDDPSDAHANYLYGLSLWRMARLLLAKKDLAAEADLVRQASAHMAVVDATWPGSHFIEGLRRDVDDRRAEIERHSLHGRPTE